MKAPIKLFRWRAVAPLLLFTALFGALWVLFADSLARRAAQSSLSTVLGTQVDIGSVRIRATQAAVNVGELAIADPRNPNRDIFEAGTITFDLAALPLLQKKLVVNELRLSGLRFGAPRKIPARPPEPNSEAGSLLNETAQWAQDKFHFPTLALGRYGSLKGLALKPEQLGSIKAAKNFGGQLDSAKSAFTKAVDGLQLQALVDSSTTLGNRLAKTDPKQLGIFGARDAATQVQRSIDGLKQARTQLASLEQGARNSVGAMQRGLADVDAARQRDYAFARSMLQLPSFDAPNIGAALFGGASVGYFQQALYYSRVVKRYVPPGLQPWNALPWRLLPPLSSVSFCVPSL